MTYVLWPHQQDAVEAALGFQEHAGLVINPTGGGKSVAIAEITRRKIEADPHGDGTILIFAHVRELLVQNEKALLRLWPDAPAGVFSAGEGRREICRITIASIQSIERHLDKLGRVDVILMDEAHLLPRSETTRYQRVLRYLWKRNRNMQLLDFTATGYRLDSGNLVDGDDALFETVIHETYMADLIAQGYLTPIRTKCTDTVQDVTDVGVRGGEFIASELAGAVDIEDINRAIVEETLVRARDRRSILVAAVSVEHARALQDLFCAAGVDAISVFGHTAKDVRDERIGAFRDGHLRVLCNVGILTTGFDAPRTDCIVLARPTQSPGLYVQIVGRGARPFPGKVDLLLLDFAQNIRRHGPVDAVVSIANNKKNGKAPVKDCPECGELVASACRTCPDCGYAFPIQERGVSGLQAVPDQEPALCGTRGQQGWREVREMTFMRNVWREPGTLQLWFG